MKFASIAYLRKNAQRDYGLDYEEALEMAYENLLLYCKRLEKATITHKPKTNGENK